MKPAPTLSLSPVSTLRHFRMAVPAAMLAVTSLFSVSASFPASAATSYRFDTLALPDAAGVPNYISTAGINNLGQVYGVTWDSRVVLWNPGVPSPVTLSPSLGNGIFDSASASAINDSGVIAGTYRVFGYNIATSASTALLWREGGTPATLSPPSGFDRGVALGINNTGQVVGTVDNSGFNNRPVLWNSDGTSAVLATLSGNSIINNIPNSANAINNNGQIAGASYAPGSFTSVAAFWNNSHAAPTALGSLGPNQGSSVTAINDAGQMAGWSDIPGGDRHAVIWNSPVSGPFDLGTLGDFDSTGMLGQAYSRAWDISANGMVVGQSFYSVANQGIHTTGFLWDGTRMMDINSLIPHGLRTGGDRISINDTGKIAGVLNTGIPFLLTPVPEPGTGVMLLAGLGLMGTIARRRQKLTAAV